MLAIAYAVTGGAYDFYAFDAAGLVYNGSAWVAWADVDFESYRIPAAESGASGRFVALLPDDTARYSMRASGVDLAASYLVWEEAVDTGGGLLPDERAKVMLIGTGMATVSAPVNAEGALDYLIVGDSYTAAHNRAFIWSVPVGTFGNLDGWAANFVANGVGCRDESTVGPIVGTIANAGEETQTVTFELSSEDSSVPAGTYRWSVYFEKNGERITPLVGNVAFRNP